MGGLGDFDHCPCVLYSMVFKVFKKVSKLSFFLQIAYALLLFVLVLLLRLNKISFLAGFVFSYLYVFLFFYSIKLIFSQKNKTAGLFLMFIKWLLLLLMLFLVAWFLEAKSFLLGLSALLVLLLSYILERVRFIDKKN